jgi:hypothetical protein
MDMRNNYIGKDCRDAILEALMHNHSIATFCMIPLQSLQEGSLVELDLSNRGLNVDEAAILAHYLEDTGISEYETVTVENLVAFHTVYDPNLVGQEETFLKLYSTSGLLHECEVAYGATPSVSIIRKENTSLVKFTFSGTGTDQKLAKPVTLEVSMAEACFSNSNLGPSGAIMLAAFLPKCR